MTCPTRGTSPHVVLVTEQVDPGGKRSHVVSLRSGFECLGWDVTLFDSAALSIPERALISVPTRLLEIIRSGSGHRWLVPTLSRLFEMRLRVVGRDRDVSVWHAQEPITLMAVRRASGGRPVALTVHGPAHREIASGYGLSLEHPTVVWLRELEREAYLAADAVISVDNAHAEYVRSFGRTGGIWVVPNFVDTRRFHRDVALHSLGPATEAFVAGRPIVLCPRRLVPKNGVDVAIRAVRQLADGNMPCVLFVAGDGPQRRDLELLTERLGAVTQVRFLGAVSPLSMPGWLRRAEAVVVPSVHHKGIEEATSISVLEAQACARPVIASAIGGLREVVEDGVNGFLVPAGSADALAGAIARVILDPGLGSKLGTAAAARVESEHSHVAGARKYAAIYAEMGVRGTAAAVQGLNDVSGRRDAAPGS